MKPNTCAQVGYCIGMYPPCMAECKLNDEEKTNASSNDGIDGLMHWLGWIVLLIASVWLVMVISFLIGYYSV